MTQQGTSNGGQQWAYNAGDEGAVGTGGGSNGYGGVEGVRRQPPLHRTMSEEVQQQLGRTLGLQAGSSGTPSYGFQPMDHARLSPSAFDPSNFSSQFVMPRFASGPSDPFGFGVGVMDPPTFVFRLFPPGFYPLLTFPSHLQVIEGGHLAHAV